MTQLRHEGFGQKPHVQRAEYQLAAKGGWRRSDGSQLPGPLEIGGAVTQTAPISAMAWEETVGYLDFATYSPASNRLICACATTVSSTE
jgi:hypothetical protein